VTTFADAVRSVTVARVGVGAAVVEVAWNSTT
jgi:hypothetical protein